MAKSPELLAFRRVERSFGRLKALAGVDLSVAPSEFVGLVAPAGSGKTAILNLCVGLSAPDRGTVLYNGTDMSRHLSSVRNEIGAVMGATDLELDRSVRANLRFASDLYGLRRREADARIAVLLKHFHLAEHERDRVHALSDTQRRRVAIVRALIHAPRLLLLNGIADGLEPGPAKQLLEETAKLCAEERIAVIWATERADELSTADRLLVLHRGRIVFDGPPGELSTGEEGPTLAAAIEAMTGPEASR